MMNFQFHYHRHLNLFRSFIDGNALNLRQLALQIIRNMSFNAADRSVLMTSDDFFHVVHTVLNKGTPFERLIIVTSIWKLIALNSKGKNTIKNSKIFHRLRKLHDELVVATTMTTTRDNAANGNDDNFADGERNEQLAEEILDELRIAVDHTLKILQV